MRGFRAVDGLYVAGLGPTEREVFADVVADVAHLLGAERFAASSGGSADDDAVAAEFRRLTEADLRSTKIARLRDLWHALTREGDRVPGVGLDDDLDLAVPRDDAPALAAALTDVRLVLADRLGLESEEDADRLYAALEEQAAAEEAGWVPDDDRPAREVVAAEARAYLGSVYAALTWLQESLMAVLLADLGRTAD